MHDSVRKLIEAKAWSGLLLKQVPGNSWHVINVTLRVKANNKCYTYGTSKCEICGRFKEITGSINQRTEIEIPDVAGVFFSPTFDRNGSSNRDRDVFISEDIMTCLKSERMTKGAFFTRLIETQS